MIESIARDLKILAYDESSTLSEAYNCNNEKELMQVCILTCVTCHFFDYRVVDPQIDRIYEYTNH